MKKQQDFHFDAHAYGWFLAEGTIVGMNDVGQWRLGNPIEPWSGRVAQAGLEAPDDDR